MRTITMVLTAAATVAAAMWLAVLDTPEYSSSRLALVLFAGCALVGSGLVTVANGEHRLGGLLAASGAAWLLERLLQAIPTSITFTTGQVITGLWAGLLVHALIAFPSGRVTSRVAVAIVAVGYVLCSVANLPEFVVFPWSELLRGPDGPAFLLSVSEDAGLALTMSRLADGLTLAWFVALLTLIGHRALRAAPPTRRAFGAVWLTSAACFVMGGTIVAAGLGWLPESSAYGVWLEAAVGTVPLVFATTLVLARLAQDRLVTLLVDLERRDTATDLRAALRRALADPSLDVVYWHEQPRGWIDAAGGPVTLPAAGGARAVTPIEHGSQRVGALVHDPILLRSPERMRTACAAAGLALDNERLKADLRARLRDVRESRARIVEAGDRERRRIERNLHDGAQQRLMSVAMTIRLAESHRAGDTGFDGLLAEAASELDGAIRDLRELARGLHPAILTDVGLHGAIEALAERSGVPVRLSLEIPEPMPGPIDVGAYYVVAEALANVTKHSRASGAAVKLAQRDGLLLVEVADDGAGGARTAPGSGLQGLSDRVDSLGGRLHLDSETGSGTILTAELPCA